MRKSMCILFMLFVGVTLFAQSSLTVVGRGREGVGVNNEGIYGDALVREGVLNFARNRSGEKSVLALLHDDAPITLNLFADFSVVAEKQRVKNTPDGGVYWVGTVVSGESGDVSLFYKNGLLSGAIYGDGVVYTISGISPTVMSVVEVDPAQLPERECDHSDEFDSLVDAQVNTGATRNRAHTVVDILIVYPTATQTSAGGAMAMAQEVAFRIAEANEIFVNSDMDISFRLVHHEVNNDVPAAASSAGDVDVTSVKNLRDQYGADLVSHWNYGGSAGSGNNYSGNPESAYNTSNFSDVKSRFTFVHECGHNMGGKHDRYTYREQGRASELLDTYYKYGYFMDGSDGGTYRTVMSYNQCSDFGIGGSCTRVKHFSNPSIYYKDAVTGVPAPSSEAANNARRLGECAPDVATFRATVVIADTYQLTVNGGDGDGAYEEGTQVAISGRDSSASGKEFSHWSGDISYVGDVNSIATTVTMPAQNISITAVYVPIVVEPLDTSNLSIDLVAWAGWEKEIDTYGSSVEIDTTAIDSEGVLSTSMTMVPDNELAGEYSWAKSIAYFDSTFDSVTVIKLTYTASADVDIILEQEILTDSGVAYHMTLPASTQANTVYLEVDSFVQYGWTGSLVASLDLSKVTALSFQPVAKGAQMSMSLEELRMTNFEYDIVSSATVRAERQNSVHIAGIQGGDIRLSVAKPGDYHITVHSVNGREVYRSVQGLRAGVNSVPLNGVQSGVYLITIQGNSGYFRTKITAK